MSKKANASEKIDVKKAEVKARKELEEAKERAKREIKEAKERVKKEVKEAKERAKREAQEAKERKKREAIEAGERAKREAIEARERAKREDQEAKEREKGEAQEAVSGELYEGIVPLTIVPPIDLGQVRKLEEHLSQVQDLRLVLVGGSVDEGTEIVVSADKPIPLIDALREMPPVEQIVKKGQKIQVTLKAE